MLCRYYQKQLFLHDHQPFLEEDEITNALMIGLLHRDTLVPDLLVAVTKGSQRLLGLIAGKKMILASNTIDPELYSELIAFMDNIDYPGILGPKQYCEVYQRLYNETHMQPMSLEMDQRIYYCDSITNIGIANGTVRLAEQGDIDVLAPWAYDFEVMVEGTADLEKIRELLIKRIDARVLYVLEVDGTVVSMTQRARPLKSTETVSLVYTPIDLRKQGYATKLVEQVTKEIIEAGRIAILYTDLSNPTSNKIYMDIGYIPHCDSVMYKKENS